ncbi:MAG: metallophosphoesterase family protein [Candidatus Aenigmarchaeota archaeon]|nr:metallophosphoesterase family protein [Candidatus Aenigmarchaeota archaeon]
MLDRKILHDAGQIFDEEPRLIELPQTGYGVFVGDTHGDLNATQTVLENYLGKKDKTLVFLGDYVDRGPHSRENIDLLLETKVRNRNRVYLLMGNHEGYKFGSFSPADFWESLSWEEKEEYGSLLAKLPLVAQSKNGIISLHGALPDVRQDQLAGIEPIMEQWERIIWGDFQDKDYEYMGSPGGRHTFGRKYFERVMRGLGKKVLIRSHQPRALQIMFDNKCLTIFTSHAYTYPPYRSIAVADLGKETASVDGLDIRTV